MMLTDLNQVRGYAIPTAAHAELAVVAPWPSGYLPVAALTVIRRSTGRTEVLVGVRDPRSNPNHPDVVSVPTRRVANPSTFGALSRLATRGPGSALADQAELHRFTEDLLCRKLGLADWLELGGQPRAVLRRLDFGESLIGPDTTERLGMFGVEVSLPPEAPVPERTGSYSLLHWLDVSLFLGLAEYRDPTVLPLGLRAAEVCVQGLCMHSAAEIVRREFPDVLPARTRTVA